MSGIISVLQREEPSKPLAVITKNDHGGLIVVITALALAFVLVSLMIRAYVRFKSGPWHRDDEAFTAASVFAFVQAVPLFSAVHYGLGKVEDLLTASEIEHIQKLAYASDLLYIFCIFFSKASSGCLYLRLTPSHAHNIAVWAILVSCVLWLVISIFLAAVRCHSSEPWRDWTTSQCKDLVIRWDVIGAIDIITEMALFSMSIYLIYNLQMARRLKAYVLVAFGSRLLVVPAIIARLVYLKQALNPTDRSSGSITLLIGSAIVCAQLEIGYGILASAFPTLKPFIAAYEGPRDAAIATDYNMSKLSESGKRTLNASSITSTGKPESATATPHSGITVRDLGSRFRTDGAKYSADVRNISRDRSPPDQSATTNPSHHSWVSHRLSCTVHPGPPSQTRSQRRHSNRQRHRSRRHGGGGGGDVENPGNNDSSFYSSASSGDESSRRIIIQKKVDWSVTERDRRPSDGAAPVRVRSDSRQAFGLRDHDDRPGSNDDISVRPSLRLPIES